MKLLIDSDMLLYKSATATEVEVQVSDYCWTRHSQISEALQLYWDQVQIWVDTVGASFDDCVHCLSGNSFYRKELYPNYKAARKDKPKPIGFRAMREQILTERSSFMYDSIEADDLLSIFADMLRQESEDHVICSKDKDLDQVPGRHLWVDEDRDVSKADAIKAFYRQCLSGDSTDGIPGCPGLGDIGAARKVEKLNLSQPVDCWEAIVREYAEAHKAEQRKADKEPGRKPHPILLYEPEEFAILQARLVRMLNSDDYDFETHKVRLWKPPTR